MKKTILLITSLLFFYFTTYSQECNKKENASARAFYEKVVELYMEDYNNSTKILKQAIEREPMFVDAYFLLGKINFDKYIEAIKTNKKDNVNDFLQESLENFNKTVEICAEYKNYQSYFFLGEIYFYKNEITKADNYYKLFSEKNKINTKLHEYVKIRKKYITEYYELINNPVYYNPVKLTKLSSPKDEFMPLLSADMKTMYYTRRHYKDNNSDFIEEITTSQRLTSIEDNEEIYTEGKPLPPPFNQGEIQGAISLTINNKIIYITMCSSQRSVYTAVINCDIYYSTFYKSGWLALKKLPAVINSGSSFEGQPSISSTGKVLYFASNRKGGYGGYDIYKAEIDSTGFWRPPENLGPQINTAGDEKTPFIHTDAHTLFFASNGRVGIGGYDIFISQLTENNTWTVAKNIGYPINTKKDELAYTVSIDGKKMYFSAKDTVGTGWDIYSTDLPENVRPERVLYLQGKITDYQNKPPVNVSVELTNTNTLKTTEGLVDKYTGDYAVSTSVEEDDKYIMTVQSDDTFFKSYYIDPFSPDFEPPTELNINLKPIKINIPVELQMVNFATNSWELNKESIINLNQLLLFLEKNPKTKIIIQGHTDNIGKKQDNQILSQNRINSVQKYLLNHGIEEKRLTTKAFGETKPKVSNSTKDGRSVNRRVEFVVIEK